LTRAKEQLFILSEEKTQTGTPKNYAHFFINYLKFIGKWNEQNLIYNFGKKNRISKKEKEKILSREQTEFISSDWKNHNITIVAKANFEPNFNDARKYGTIIHEILAKIYTKDDIYSTIQYFINEGIIPIDKEQEITKLINAIATHKQLEKYFTREITVLNEREIVNDHHQMLIPDRLIFDQKNVTIIDYKTGKIEKKHTYQINQYAAALSKMNYTIIDKLLVYIGTNVKVIKVIKV
jgi:ATP-dependent exoDNAse (exonuclease V) beta subunit